MQIIKLSPAVSLHLSDTLSSEDEFNLDKIKKMFSVQITGITMQFITTCVCEYFNITLEEIKFKAGYGKYSLARHYVYYLCDHYKLDYSQQQMVMFFNRNNHSGAFHGINKIRKAVYKEGATAKHILNIRILIKKYQQNPVNIIS